MGPVCLALLYGVTMSPNLGEGRGEARGEQCGPAAIHVSLLFTASLPLHVIPPHTQTQVWQPELVIDSVFGYGSRIAQALFTLPVSVQVAESVASRSDFHAVALAVTVVRRCTYSIREIQHQYILC